MPPTQENGELLRCSPGNGELLRCSPENGDLLLSNGGDVHPNDDVPTRASTSVPATPGRIVYLQVLMGLLSNIGTLTAGMTMGFSAIALPALTNADGTFYLNEGQASWFVSLSAFAMPVGCLLCGPGIDRFGRRAMLVLLNVPSLCGWLLIAGAAAVGNDVPGLTLLMSGRVLTGIGTGMASSTATVYLAEVAASTKMRSVLVTWTSVSIAAGVLLVYLLGALLPLSWWLNALICALLPLISLIATLVVLPESPVWLISRGRLDDATRALKTLRGEASEATPSTNILRELDALRAAPRSKVASAWAMVSPSRPDAYRPLFVMNGYFLFQQASGVFVVVFYAVDIAHHAAGVTVDGYMASVLIGLTRLVFTIAVSVTSGRVGRRPASLASGVVMAGAMAGLGLHLVLQSDGGGVGATVGVALLVTYIAAATCGFLTLPWAMLAEVLPADVRGTASGVTTCFTYLVSFCMIKWYPSMLSALGASGLFFCYALLSLAGTVFLYFFLPETKGKSVQEIADFFKGDSKSRNTGSSGPPGVPEADDSSLAFPLLINNDLISIVEKK